MRQTNIIGKTYGKLTVIGIDRDNSEKNLRVFCRCECGKVISVARSNLQSNGGQRSCGCTRAGKKVIDLTGMKFGELTAIEFVNTVGVNSSKHAVWKCLCSCGNFVNVRACNLKSGHTTSCGCKLAEAQQNAKIRVSALKQSEKTGRFETNIRAKRWTLISPDGDTYHVKNLSLFIRENASMFGIRNIDVETKRQMKRMSDASHRGYKCDGWTIKCNE